MSALDEALQATEWFQSDEIELDEACAEYQAIKFKIKLLEGQVKEHERSLEDVTKRIQAKMDGRKAVKAPSGYMVRWFPSKRKGYTVADWEGERWELRSPF